MGDAPTFDVPPPALDAARRTLDRGLCAECRGRLFGRLGHGLTNPERAERLARALGVTAPGPSGPCSLCGDLFGRLDVWVDRAGRSVDVHPGDLTKSDENVGYEKNDKRGHHKPQCTTLGRAISSNYG